MHVNVVITNRDFRKATLKRKTFTLKRTLVQGNYYRKIPLAIWNTCATRLVTRTRLITRSTRLSTRRSSRLSTRGACQFTRTIYMSTRNTRSFIYRSFYNWSTCINLLNLCDLVHAKKLLNVISFYCPN